MVVIVFINTLGFFKGIDRAIIDPKSTLAVNDKDIKSRF